ncbi:protein-glutamate methylesterase/protein-glutamine glutaminase [Pleionea sediminis]|uniref:protein-glutamate methylesterase/protein-glutamine glutaminase n=1 Tax=Pleionea sediminis TaxID=2569479 RepID=UPI0011856269|nr:chemotaxis response regulator protein-glutamate methylesterase [Pleionea sediminis]
MAIKVLVVDDSNFFCRRVAQILSADPEIKVVGIANNGREAIDKVRQLKPDVITLDVEMPVMDGITALKQIMKEHPTKALMLSSLTYEGAKLTLDALDAGAVDFMLKSYEGISQASGELASLLRKKVRSIGQSVRTSTVTSTPQKAPEAPRATSASIPQGQIKLIAIGASTGGPVALQKILTELPGNFPIPITITQHMPGTFTGAFAQRMNSLCELTVVEAENNTPLRPGHVYVAPGGKQMLIEGVSSSAKIRIKDTDARLQYAPCVDVTYASAAKVFSANVLAIVLTGMGADGREGARILKEVGATVWTQDEASCVVYGMPMSVKRAGFSDLELGIDAFATQVKKVV